ncbi:hypothetical protein D3C71_2041430 [compost metagenome]
MQFRPVQTLHGAVPLHIFICILLLFRLKLNSPKSKFSFILPCVNPAFRTYTPDVAVLNTAKAQMMWGTVITMTEEDIVRIS